MSDLAASENTNVADTRLTSLTIFSYAWAMQSLIQLVYFRAWFETGQPLGWIFLFFSLAVFLFPGRIRLFAGMVASGLVYYISIWPFVVNHHLGDHVIAITMLAAAVIVLGKKLLSTDPLTDEDSEDWFDKFAPVAGAIFAFVYFSIIVSKLNGAFFDLEISCLSGMIEEAEADRPLVRPFLGLFSVEFYFWVFIVAETLLPFMLAYKPTRLPAFYFGVPFHILLGLMGHWPFSSMMLTLYILMCMPMLKDVLRPYVQKIDEIRADATPWLPGSALFALLSGFFLVIAAVGKPSWAWLLWSVILAAAILFGMLREHMENGLFTGNGVINVWVKHPGWLWVMFALAVVNSTGPYLGWKTQTSIAMYSNMRTEGAFNNHFFIPDLPVFGFQDDLVEIIDSNNDEILALKTYPARYGFVGQEHEVYRVYFEFRRAVSTLEDPDLEITYLRNGEMRTFKRGDDGNVDKDLDKPLPILQAKLQYFRPVFKSERAYCLH
ncbi:MAG: hypothetical protein ACE37M_10640 [Henriciella sp.]